MRSSALTLLALLGGMMGAPAVAKEPFPSFADRVVLQCMGVGVTNVFFDEHDQVQSYAHTGHASKSQMEGCIRTAYSAILDDPYPVSVGAAYEATQMVVLHNGNIKLF